MSLRGRNFLTTQDFTHAELKDILDLAVEIKRGGGSAHPLKGKGLALLFFNPSLRTRSSFELGMFQLGGHAVVLAPGKDAWPMEPREGVVMDGEAEEHVKEATRVLCRFFDGIAVRCFPKFQNWAEDRLDPMLTAIAKYSTKPVINMETIVHPCQELALMQTIREHLGEPRKKKFLLTWTWHPKGLNTAVANSAALISTKFGMDVTILRPEGYDLDPRYVEAARENAKAQGGSLTVTSDIEAAYRGADFVYAKSWGAIPYFGRWEEEKQVRAGLKHFIVDAAKMKLTNNARFSHCLPMRRNVKVTDEVADSPAAMFIDEAENRLHVQKALLARLLG
ncbi:MAG: N-acetylornithine carbamoyltransferase [Planctomycetes bacterium]|nr:N-acetylornithine carbamoyltransferase [Planctomycetota bacterium]